MAGDDGVSPHGAVGGSARRSRSAGSSSRHTELGAFLRSRRERRTPGEVGLTPGPRRRTPGLRREEVALLAGVGLTWYTWLEQGRAINASAQVLDAIARTLGLDPAERTHLYRLSGIEREVRAQSVELPPEFGEILDHLRALPAAVYNARFDVLASNAAYDRVFPMMVARPRDRRNVVTALFEATDSCDLFVDRDDEATHLVAELQTAFGRHVGEPEWTRFVDELMRGSAEFARMWGRREVASPQRRIRRIRNAEVGSLNLVATRLTAVTPETHVIVHTPADPPTRERLDRLLFAANPHAPRRVRRRSHAVPIPPIHFLYERSC
ncbi:helix-turn-helix transcriptional regulator [Embleya hyalina]|uniref:Transcriptional regulator n=1 Tax=Embleya hyalina TaxID=516124 RepID=A0A401YQJ9_9ACTN|nr:helix-turn-helix transcriptional regulator [Embleya hyalina]GCD96889.1 transcriptional regulator [Embleya hyalina]